MHTPLFKQGFELNLIELKRKITFTRFKNTWLIHGLIIPVGIVVVGVFGVEEILKINYYI